SHCPSTSRSLLFALAPSFSSRMQPVFLVVLYTDTAPTDIYTLSLHDALPIYWNVLQPQKASLLVWAVSVSLAATREIAFAFSSSDRKSTRLNSSHVSISYAVFCLKKKTKRKVPVSVELRMLSCGLLRHI